MVDVVPSIGALVGAKKAPKLDPRGYGGSCEKRRVIAANP